MGVITDFFLAQDGKSVTESFVLRQLVPLCVSLSYLVELGGQTSKILYRYENKKTLLM